MRVVLDIVGCSRDAIGKARDKRSSVVDASWIEADDVEVLQK
jgi:hypothetical protein